MGTLQTILATLFGAVLDPAAALGPMGGLVVISAVSGIVLLFAFRYTSRPAAIRAAKRRIQGNLLAVRIYREDLGVVFGAQGRVFAALGAYMGNMMVPFLAILVPFAILFAHLDARYALRAMRPGERAIVKAIVTEGNLDRWTLRAEGGVEVDSPPVRIGSRGEIAWRVRAVTPGRHRVVLVAGEREVVKEIVVSEDFVGAPAMRAVPGLDGILFAPVEDPIDPATGVREIVIGYPALPLRLLGWDLHWIVLFLAVSAVVAFALRKRAGVEF